MSDATKRVTITDANHHSVLIKRLWKFMRTRHRVDLDFSGAGRTVAVHHLIIDAFLQPDRLARSNLHEKHLRRSSVGGSSSLGALVEFMYRGRVTVRQEKLTDLLELAKELDFKMLVDAIDAGDIVDVMGNSDVIENGEAIELGNDIENDEANELGEDIDNGDSGDVMTDDALSTGVLTTTDVVESDAVASYDVTTGDSATMDTLSSGAAASSDVIESDNAVTGENMTSDSGMVSIDPLLSGMVIQAGDSVTMGDVMRAGDVMTADVFFESGDIITCTSAVILESGDVIRSDDGVTCYEVVQSDLISSGDHETVISPMGKSNPASRNAAEPESDDSDWERRLSEPGSDDDDQFSSHQTLNVMVKDVEDDVAMDAGDDAGEPRFKCPRCDYATQKRWRFSHHMFSRHQLNCRGVAVEKRVCEDCKFVCKTESQMKYHRLATHSGTRPYSCPQCPFTSGRKVAIGQHLRNVHQRLRPHLCDECGYSTACAYGLVRHKRKHNGEKPFKCGTCGVGFSDHSGLRRHERAGHGSGDKTHVCHVCGNSYNRRDNLRAHLAKSHRITMTVEV